ncbi:MAG: NADH-quinone oxidoreductase subunit J [Syntrophales bacterium]
MAYAFYIAATVAVISTFLVISRMKVVHALLYLVMSLLSVALIFFILGAPFIAALEVIIYAGAIIVLFIFVIMMLKIGPETVAWERRLLEPRMWKGPSVLAAILFADLAYILARAEYPPAVYRVIGPGEVGIALLGPYLIGVELASILLLAALVGAFHLGRRYGREIEIPDQEGTIRDTSEVS